jgi:hypothetical protein
LRQRTVVKRDVLPEHVADTLFAPTGGNLSQTTECTCPSRRSSCDKCGCRNVPVDAQLGGYWPEGLAALLGDVDRV